MRLSSISDEVVTGENVGYWTVTYIDSFGDSHTYNEQYRNITERRKVERKLQLWARGMSRPRRHKSKP